MIYLNDNRVNVSLEGGVMTVASEENNLLGTKQLTFTITDFISTKQCASV